MNQLEVGPVIPVSDLDASLKFYEGSLGLSGEHVPGGYVLRCGGNTRIYLLPSTDYPGRAKWPLMSFETDRLEHVVDDLRAAGIEFVSFDEGPQKTDERGIADMDGVRLAWITDPDDQVISLFEPS